MKTARRSAGQSLERGAALLIAIFALLLISVVAIALVVSSGTDSALASNFRSSTNAYYAALAGLEEARGRLLPYNANCIELPPSSPPPPNTPCIQPVMPLADVFYIINPASGEIVAPWNTSNPSTYPDTEYLQEFGVDVSTRTVSSVASVSPVASLPGPNYKWVRINPVTESILGEPPTGVDINGDGTVDNTTLLFYDPAYLNFSNQPSPGLIENPFPPPTAGQALEITAYAVLPSGTHKMLQYVVRPLSIFPRLNMPGLSVPGYPAALTIAGNNVTFTGPGTGGFYIQGQDQCTGSPSIMPAIGYTNSGTGDNSENNIMAGAAPSGNYLGAPMSPLPSTPHPPSPLPSMVDVSVSINQSWLTPTGLAGVIQEVTQSADAVIQGPATPSSFPPGMSATHPMTIVVNGDLDLNSWHNTGYGLLLVTGTLKYDPDASWQGVVLVIGQGNFVSTKGGSGQINGAMYIAKIYDASNNLLSSLGATSFSQTGSGGNLGNGVYFNSCVVLGTEGPIAYKILAFKEIPLT